jgi:hypothetical protein
MKQKKVSLYVQFSNYVIKGIGCCAFYVGKGCLLSLSISPSFPPFPSCSLSRSYGRTLTPTHPDSDTRKPGL